MEPLRRFMGVSVRLQPGSQAGLGWLMPQCQGTGSGRAWRAWHANALFSAAGTTTCSWCS